MTIPRRTDVSTGENFAAQRPTVLAELPHIGEPVITTQSRAQYEPAPETTRNLRSSHPAFAELPDAHEDELFEEQRPRQQSGRRQTRFIDQAHIDHEWERQQFSDEADFEPSEPRRRSAGRVVQRHAPSKPTAPHTSGWRGLLSDAHAQLAPFAGLIVTAALIASAGLIFLMMAGNRQKNAGFDEFALPGFQVEANNKLEQADSEESAPLAESAFDETQADGLEFAPSSSTEQQTLPTTTTPTDSSAAIPQPVIEENAEPSVPLGSLSFPVTNTPLALDYRKAMVDPAEGLQELPEVAERGNLPATEPINR